MIIKVNIYNIVAHATKKKSFINYYLEDNN